MHNRFWGQQQKKMPTTKIPTRDATNAFNLLLARGSEIEAKRVKERKKIKSPAQQYG